MPRRWYRAGMEVLVPGLEPTRSQAGLKAAQGSLAPPMDWAPEAGGARLRWAGSRLPTVQDP